MKAFWLEEYKLYVKYADINKGSKTLIFIHGLGSSSFADFTDTIGDKRFSEFRCILIDLPGHGFSDDPENFNYTLYDHAKVVENLLDHLGIKDAVFIGHSMGGTIEVAIAQKRIDLISHMIMIESNLDPGIGSGSKVITSYNEKNFLETGYKNYFSQIKNNKNNQGEVVYPGIFKTCSPLAIYKSAVGLLEGTNPTQRTIIKTLSVPRSYFVSDQNIDHIPVSELEELGFTVYVIPQSGHALMHDNPVVFNNMLIKEIKRIDKRN